MEKVIETTDLISLGLSHCGAYPGEFQEEAYKLLGKEWPTEETTEWADIMIDRSGKVFAVWSKNEMVYNDASIYMEINKDDCPAAFRAAEYEIERIDQEKEEERERWEDEKRRNEVEAAKTEARHKRECDENAARRNGEF